MKEEEKEDGHAEHKLWRRRRAHKLEVREKGRNRVKKVLHHHNYCITYTIL